MTAKDAIAAGFGNVRGPDEEFSPVEIAEEYDDNSGTGSEAEGDDTSVDAGGGTHDDPGD